ncbi:T3SS effector HopA1 family protein [Thermocoleostomius sinensis]|uniref:T3SS effector HopA1 family protein n=1 Tax=Thermocoleostomius sinensis A174 TaxID=2016057 RepID=A0A9E8Z9I2_9CYAN|nr:T3SS effector HopA1 family protein [Thermocoleostomius sinensis]WAL58762.1 T3SS effector HopA1 family protein [Thermocoleostomius sinensis A174]
MTSATSAKITPFLLGTHNVIDYLSRYHSFSFQSNQLQKIELKACKNFNLVVEVSPDRHILVKQEPHDERGQTKGDLSYEWLLYESLQESPTAGQILNLMSEFVAFDQARSIAIFNYLTEYSDLDQFYTNHQQFPTSIAAALGYGLASIHYSTFGDATLQQTLAEQADFDASLPDFGQELRYLSPDIFGKTTSDGLKFYELYQRYDSLAQAIDRLSASYHACCLTHQDLKFNNILLHTEWQNWAASVQPKALHSIARSTQSASLRMPLPILYHDQTIIRFIDWEKWAWGDPAFDVGTIIASYLKIWLKSLTLSPDISIETALRLAVVPLDVLQPSMRLFVRSYLAHFPQILQEFPEFLSRVMQFAGLALIESLQAHIQYYEPFGNVGIGMMEVAKALLCSPEATITTIFGLSAAELTRCEDVSPETSADEAIWSLPPLTIQSPQPVDDQKPSMPAKSCEPGLQNNKMESVDDVLQDIAHHLHLSFDGEFDHDRFNPMELSLELRARFNKFPPDLKQTLLTTHLRNYLYDLYYSGEHLACCESNNDLSGDAHKNDTIRGINLDFFQAIDQANTGRGYFDPDWRIQSRTQDKKLIVQKNGLVLHVRRQQLAPEQFSKTIGDLVAIYLPHNLLESDFYVAVSQCGPIKDSQPTLEICFNVTSTGAIELMRRLTHGLNRLTIPFTFKVLLHLDQYHRYDTGVLHIERQHYSLIFPLLQHIYLATQSQFRSKTPFLTKQLAPGIGLAEEPLNGLEFGLHRCQILAEALLTAKTQGKNTPSDRLAEIERLFSQHGISLQFPYLNEATGTNSDPYIPLDRC